MAKSLLVKSKKQHIRLWFEFYKLALADKHLKNYIQASSAYYAAWGDVQSFTFDDWWKDHKYLFGASQVEEITKARNFSKQPNVINLTIPLDLPVSNSVKEVKRLIQLKQLQRMVLILLLVLLPVLVSTQCHWSILTSPKLLVMQQTL